MIDDQEIINLYLKRSETAITETNNKYGKYCYTISYNILKCIEDTEECVNETWYVAWKNIPPVIPHTLSMYLGKITRNLSLAKYKKEHSQKRNIEKFTLVLEELEECISSASNVEDSIIEQELVAILNNFLETLPEKKRNIFVCRYWHLYSIADLSNIFSMSESHVKTTLHRLRLKLKKYMIKEGYFDEK
ncbi:MAG: sigma-70 family RNA polymerase sigma factor [Lachnospiraceae bacterium]|nr:sigma-70 family RNA polymerase sigma factor [Lachnospiraceae bacterium]